MTSLDVFSLCQASQKTTHIRIASTVGVNNLGLVELQNWILCAVAMVRDASAICALRDDDITVLSLGAWDQREPCRNKGDVLSVPALSLSPGTSLCFVTKEEVHIWD